MVDRETVLRAAARPVEALHTQVEDLTAVAAAVVRAVAAAAVAVPAAVEVAVEDPTVVVVAEAAAAITKAHPHSSRRSSAPVAGVLAEPLLVHAQR